MCIHVLDWPLLSVSDLYGAVIQELLQVFSLGIHKNVHKIVECRPNLNGKKGYKELIERLPLSRSSIRLCPWTETVCITCSQT